MLIGLLAGIITGALWGFAFIAPLLAAPYSPFDLTIGRYLVFGLASLAVLAPSKFQTLRALNRRDWILITQLGFAGNAGYYLVMSLAVPRAGPAVVALIIGCLPVVIGILGNRGEHRIPARKLLPSLILIATGLLAVNGSALTQARAHGTLPTFITGVALTLLALGMWAWYAIINDRALADRQTMSPLTWTALAGVGSLLPLAPIVLAGGLAGWSMLPTLGLSAPPALHLIVASLGAGLLSSWAATWSWSVATRRLPVSLAGQLIVFETIFALIYSAAYQATRPNPTQSLGAALLIAGVIVAMHVFAKNPAPQPETVGRVP